MSQPSLPPLAPTAPPPARAASPVWAFALDVVLAAVILLSVSLVAGIAWGIYRGAVLGVEAAKSGASADAGAQIAAQMGQPGALAQLLMALVSTGTAAVVLYLWRRRATAGERQHSRAQILKATTWGWIAVVAAAIFAGSSLISWAGKQLGITPTPTNLPLMQEALSQFPAFLLIFAVVLAPAYEELLFRRVLFGRLWAASRPWLGMVLSSVAFALLHEIPGTSDRGMAEVAQLWLVYGGMGAAFAWVYRRTGTLWAPVIVHGINNAIAMSVLYAGGAGL